MVYIFIVIATSQNATLHKKGGAVTRGGFEELAVAFARRFVREGRHGLQTLSAQLIVASGFASLHPLYPGRFRGEMGQKWPIRKMRHDQSSSAVRSVGSDQLHLVGLSNTPGLTG